MSLHSLLAEPATDPLPLYRMRDGIIAVDLRADDTLVGVALTDGTCDIMLCTSGGKAIRFHEQEVRPMGRDATGVRGVRLRGRRA